MNYQIIDWSWPNLLWRPLSRPWTSSRTFILRATRCSHSTFVKEHVQVSFESPSREIAQFVCRELQTDIKGWKVPKHGYLEKWARQGVLLLNAVLTVERATPNSHAKKGWEQFTDAALKKVNTDRESAVFFLWGAYAQKKEPLINKGKHLVLKSGHPSPLSVKHFLGCKHFSKANEFLQKKGLDTIDWQLDLEDSAAGVNDSTDAEQSPKKKAATTKKAPPKKKAAAKKDSEEEPEEEDDE